MYVEITAQDIENSTAWFTPEECDFIIDMCTDVIKKSKKRIKYLEGRLLVSPKLSQTLIDWEESKNEISEIIISNPNIVYDDYYRRNYALAKNLITHIISGDKRI